jgi:hypothetical protein
MPCVSLVGVAFGNWFAEFAQNDDASWAPVDTESAASAHVVIDGENGLVLRIGTGKFGSLGTSNSAGSYEMNTFPGANVDTALANNAFGLIDMNVLLGLYPSIEPGSVDFLQDIIVAEGRKGRIGISDSH